MNRFPQERGANHRVTWIKGILFPYIYRVGGIPTLPYPVWGQYTSRRQHTRYFHSHGRLSPHQPLTKARRFFDFIASATSIAAGTPVRQGGEWSGAAQALFR
jgi:hypothetical protein